MLFCPTTARNCSRIDGADEIIGRLPLYGTIALEGERGVQGAAFRASAAAQADGPDRPVWVQGLL